MALVSYLPPERREIPHEPNQWMEFRRPSSRVVREARRVAEAEGRQGVRDFGPEIVKALNQGDDDERAVRRIKQLEADQEYHPAQFDRETLLRSAIVAWSYTDLVGNPVAVTPARIAELDEVTARWAHHVVIEMIAPPSKEAEKSAPEAASPAP